MPPGPATGLPFVAPLPDPVATPIACGGAPRSSFDALVVAMVTLTRDIAGRHPGQPVNGSTPKRTGPSEANCLSWGAHIWLESEITIFYSLLIDKNAGLQ
jgi:hypothetical protein